MEYRAVNRDPGVEAAIDLDDYRNLINRALAGHAADRPAWETDGHLPASVFSDLGAAGAFSNRWAHQSSNGLRYSIALAEECVDFDSGLALGVAIHAETFLGTVQRLARNDYHRSVVSAALAGDAIGSIAITEPTGGSDISAVMTEATETRHGWHLHGSKRFVSNIGTATHFITLARSVRGHLALVIPVDDPSVDVIGFYDKIGTRTCDLGHIEIAGHVADDFRLSAPGMGLVTIHRALESERLIVSAKLLYLSRRIVRLAVAYARRRHQFSKRLIDHESIGHRLANLNAQCMSADALLEAILRRVDGSQRLHAATAALKLQAAAVASAASDTAIQVFGARGYTTNYPLARYWQDVRIAHLGAGTDEMMHELILRTIDVEDAAAERWLDEFEARDHPSP